MNCCDCPYFEEDCKYGTNYIICSKKLKEVKQDKKEVKIDLQKKYINNRSKTNQEIY